MTNPKPTTNEQIALELGYKRASEPMAEGWIEPGGIDFGWIQDLPDFEHDWKCAGPLLEELIFDEDAVGDLQYYYAAPFWGMSRQVRHETITVRADTATEAISHAWLAWKKEEKA